MPDWRATATELLQEINARADSLGERALFEASLDVIIAMLSEDERNTAENRVYRLLIAELYGDRFQPSADMLRLPGKSDTI